MDDYLESFYLRLHDEGFEPSECKTYWIGRVSVEWENDENGKEETAEHLIKIWLPESFPYHVPVVYSIDNPPLTPSWHLAPGDSPTLCLWDSETGWRPNYTAHKFLNRICDWFYYYHTDSWPASSQVPDLHLYLDKIGTVIVGEDWIPTSDISNGWFSLWRSKNYADTPSIATSTGELSEPEPRLADNVILGSNPLRLQGAWFRVPRPFVPSNRLEVLLHQIDDLMQEPPGWALKKCVAATGRKSTRRGFPTAIGYPDHLNKERWLFLWTRFPEGSGKRYKWSSRHNLPKIELNSFQTAPASKDALLRRSAYISKSLTSKRVALFGVGALGSSIALLLAKAGVRELRLIDSDYVMPGNAMRHICGLNRIGLSKTTAVKLSIQGHNPDCHIQCYEATWVQEKLSFYIRDCDLVINATGNINFSLYLNKICVEFNQPILFVATYRRARVGRVISRLEKGAPCLSCYLDHQRDWPDNMYPTIPANSDESFIEDGCGSVTEEAVALDIEAVANFGTRQIVRFFQGTNDGSNLGLIVNEPLPDAENKYLCSPGMHFWTNKANTSCSICGT